MESIDPEQDRRVDRRTFLKGGLVAGALLGGAGIAVRAVAGASDDSPSKPQPLRRRTARPSAAAAGGRPNILVILVDQLRYPQWFSPAPAAIGLPPNLQRLAGEGVGFVRHYTASNDCSPARSTLLTGLYTHQTGCMITGGSTLDPGFPTWGTMLREHGYRTRWYGKWHLTHHDNRWGPFIGPPALERYGFSGGTFPSPDGAPGQGWRVDPHVAQQFSQWFAAEGHGEPWCTTVSFVNPHDIAWWYVWSDRVAAESSAAPAVRALPPNFETPEDLLGQRKPRLQRSLQATAARSFGPVPFHGADARGRWLEFANLYVKLQREVDRQIGRVLETLESRPQVAANTVVVFTSDHGEYGGSHGLRGKGASAYEEGIRVPLIVSDPRGTLTTETGGIRKQLSSSVDVAPLLLTIATGSALWREQPRYAHLAGRLDLAAILADPSTAGRSYALHATDEIVTEFAIEPYTADAPLHVVALRTARGKYARYSHWSEGTTAPQAAGTETELYDYSTHAGRLEVDNVAGNSPLEAGLDGELHHAIEHELRAPLPDRLRAAQERGLANYLSTARRAATGAAAARKRRSESTIGQLGPGDTGEGRRN